MNPVNASLDAHNQQRTQINYINNTGTTKAVHPSLERTLRSSEVAHKVIFVGDFGVGKTSLAHRYFDEPQATPRTEVMRAYVADGKKTRIMDIYDSCGQERFPQTWGTYFSGIKAVVYVFDVTSEESLNNLKKWSVEVQKYGPAKLPNIVIVGNKCDQPIQVHYDIAKMYADQCGAPLIYASATSGKGVIDLFNTLAKGMACYDPRPYQETKQLQAKKKKFIIF
eukprot:Phypoly_transcript_17410.p1 GENE.Phypoly_transcript_17410~~Phypoly_transcript_17410.p1  ORF type:complete len:245 (+),score=40.17 Phypoly_transcript_17410:65-736(+)